MNAVAAFPRFMVICSVILLIAGVAQVFVRPRGERETPLQKLINRSTITALVTVAFGIAGLLFGLGVLKIGTTREQFDAKLSTVQETIASYSAITFAKLGLHKIDDKGAKKDQEEHKTKTYKAALSFLPKDQVMVSPKLK